MKTLLIAASALAGLAVLAAPAQSADMPLPSTYDWSGAYGGFTLGLGFDNSEIDSSIHVPGRTVSDTLYGDEISLSGGAMLGYNWQVDSLVLGLEADFNFLNLGTAMSPRAMAPDRLSSAHPPAPPHRCPMTATGTARCADASVSPSTTCCSTARAASPMATCRARRGSRPKPSPALQAGMGLRTP